VQAASHLLRTVCYQNKDRLTAGIICAGWDHVDGGSVYAIPLFGVCLKVPFSIGGSGSTFIYGLVDAAYKPGMSREQCIDFVKTGAVGCAVIAVSSVWFGGDCVGMCGTMCVSVVACYGA
jgi:20S proteasome alpha/beta subunit